MRRKLSIYCVLVATNAFIFTTAYAQGSPQQPAAGGLLTSVPFDIPYGVPINLQDANRALNRALAESEKRGWPEAVAIVDTYGELVAFAKMNDTQNASPNLAIRKGATAARFRRETRMFYNAFEGGHAYLQTLDSSLSASPGGIPIIMSGKVVGAIGCSGGNGDQDAEICEAGARELK